MRALPVVPAETRVWPKRLEFDTIARRPTRAIRTQDMDEYPTDEFRTIESPAATKSKLLGYVMHPEVAKRRVFTTLSLLQDALLIWRRATGKPFFHFAPVIQQRKLDNCRVFNHRSTLLKAMPQADRTLEIGVLHGVFSREIIDTVHPVHHTMIDIKIAQIDDSLFEGVATELEKVEGKSKDVLPKLPERSFDFIYIDGAHDDESVRSDLELSARVLKPGGIIMLNDYSHWSPNQGLEYGVMKAANTFLNQADDFEMIGIAIDGTGAFDIALRHLG